MALNEVLTARGKGEMENGAKGAGGERREGE